MTSKVTVEAQSLACEVRLMPRVGDNDLWRTLSAETRRFAEFVIPPGESREYHIHSGQSVMVREQSDAPPKAAEINNHDEMRATPEAVGPGRHLFRGDGYWDKPYEAEVLEWSEGGRLKLGKPGVPRWLEARDIPFVVESLASVDTLPKGQDAQQGLAGTEGSAVANGETPTPSSAQPGDA